MKRLRILCLHGYHGSANLLRSQMSSLTAGLDSVAEFVYIDAPSLARGDFGWWHAVENEFSPGVENPGVAPANMHYKGWPDTRDWIVSVFEQKGPFDGIFGFSQGAALTGLLVGLRSPDGKATALKPLTFSFAMMVGGFPSVDAALMNLYEAKASYDLPSLHITGLSDSIVEGEYSRALAAQFNHPLILEHSGGHVIAATPEIRKHVRAFLEDMLRQRSTKNEPPPVPLVQPRGPIEISLWPRRAHPAMKCFFPKTAATKPRPAMVVFRGGAYAFSSGSGGGSAEWAAEHGMVGVEVEYRTRETNGYFPENYADAARSVRLVRRNAAEWGIDPHRVGLMGYSAGGHLASLLSTQPSLWNEPADDLAGHISARPDLVVLGYPLISFVAGYSSGAFAGSVENFFGKNAVSESRLREFSNELHVDENHPPVFIWTTREDALVPYTHAQLFADACKRANVPVAFTLYPHGPHGMGLALRETSDARNWTAQLLEWLANQWDLNVEPEPVAKLS